MCGCGNARQKAEEIMTLRARFQIRVIAIHATMVASVGTVVLVASKYPAVHTGLYIFACALIIFVAMLMVSQIKCPNCGRRLQWNPSGEQRLPIIPKHCPQCDFDLTALSE